MLLNLFKKERFYYSLIGLAMKKKVIFISAFDFNSSIAGAIRMKMYSKMLSREGVGFEFYSFQNNKFFKKSRNRFLQKILKPFNVLIFILNLRGFIRENTETVFLYYPLGSIFFEFFLLIYIKKIKKEKIFLEVNEVLKFGVSERKNKVYTFRCYLLEKISRFYNGIICISRNIEQYYLKHNENSLLLPILSNVEERYVDYCNYKSNTVFKIGFTGSIHIEKENLVTVFKSLKDIVEKGYKVELNFYGIVYEENKLKNIIEKFELGSVVNYHGIISHDNVLEILKSQDLLILPRAKNRQNDYGFSTKLAEYLISGIPVLLTDVSDNLYYLTRNVDCIVADYDDYEDFSEKIIFLMNNYSSKAPKLSKNAYNKALIHFNYICHSRKLFNFLFNRLEN